MSLKSEALCALSAACRGGVAIVVSVLLTIGSSPASAADIVWVGNDAFNISNFGQTGNWQNNTLPTWSSSNSLIFTQNQNPNVTGLIYNLPWNAVDDIKWAASFPVPRTLSSSNGNGLDFRVRLENLSSHTQTVTMNTSGGKNGASEIQLNPVNGSLILSGTIYNDYSVDYVVWGSFPSTATNLAINTELGPNAGTQADVDFTVAGGRNSSIQVNASQSWAGTTTVNSGIMTAGSGVTLASSAFLVAGGTFATTSVNTIADAATLTVNSGRLSIGGSDTVASLAGSGGTVDLAPGATLTAGGAVSTSYAGPITGSGGFTKVGSGTFTLSAASSYTGATTVSGGRLAVNGSLGATAVTVQSGGELGGSGGIGGPVAVLAGGTLSPGNSIESLAVGATTFSGTSTFEYEYDSSNPGSLGAAADLLVVSGNLTINSGALITFSDLALAPQAFVEDTTIFALVNYSGTWNGGLFTYGSTVLADGGVFAVGSQQWQIDYDRTSSAGLDNYTGNYLPDSRFVVITAVPEPAAAGLAASGVAAAAGWRLSRRRKRG
jgi:autotransporter-associated beta strand protein